MTTFTRQTISEHKPESMEELLALTVELDASDLHLTYGEPPVFRVGGDLRPMSCEAYTHEEIHALLGQVMPPRYAAVLEERREKPQEAEGV